MWIAVDVASDWMFFNFFLLFICLFFFFSNHFQNVAYDTADEEYATMIDGGWLDGGTGGAVGLLLHTE